MTIPACKLRDYYDSTRAISIRMLDGTVNTVSSNEVYDLIDAGVVEGIAANSGQLRRLRMLVEPQVAISKINALSRESAIQESPGSILSMGSQTIVRQREISNMCFAHRACLWMDGAGFPALARQGAGLA